MNLKVPQSPTVLFAALMMTACTDGTDPEDLVPEPEASCAAAPLQTCVDAYSDAIASCYETADGPCADDDTGLTAALDALEAGLEGCTVAGLDEAATVGRLRTACASEASSLAWRTFGGPQGAVWAGASEGNRTCLQTAHDAVTTLVTDSLAAIETCLSTEDCDVAATVAEREALSNTARNAVISECVGLADLIAVDSRTLVDRSAQQADCLAATIYDDPGELPLSCGPSNVQFEAPRAEWTQVIVDSDIWGTQCGDGSDYAFYIRWAPEGAPLDRMIIGLQGGGVCLFEGDCTSRLADNPGLFTAMDDMPLEVAVVSNDAAVSPFADWTKVYLPYCNQDVFAGGGVDEVFENSSVPRYGSVNLRAAVSMVRDALWAELDAAGGPGFRPDEVVTLFGGWSAGGYGTLYNYHWMIDDLQWPRTIAFPDAGLALDNGTLEGVRGIGLVKIPVWGTQAYLPPYCFAGDCAVGEDLYNAISPRLLQVPEQQMLILTNPLDTIQEGDAFFNDSVSFINEMRASYCRTRDLPGIQYYFTNVSDEPVHVVTLREDLWGTEVDGVTMRDWFQRAVEQPTTITDRVQEADFVTAVPGVEPFPCDVAP